VYHSPLQYPSRIAEVSKMYQTIVFLKNKFNHRILSRYIFRRIGAGYYQIPLLHQF